MKKRKIGIAIILLVAIAFSDGLIIAQFPAAIAPINGSNIN